MNELNEKALEEVSGGWESDLEADFMNYISKAGRALTWAVNSYRSSGDTARTQICSAALSETMSALNDRLHGVPWSPIKVTVSRALTYLNVLDGKYPAEARAALETILTMLAEY